MQTVLCKGMNVNMISLKKQTASYSVSLSLLLAIGEPVSLEWYNPQGERIAPSKRVSLHSEATRSRLIIYNAIIEDAGIYRCQAADATGHTEEATVVLEIYRKSHLPPSLPPEEIQK